MANYATLKAAVADVVKTNGTQEITGANLQAVLLSIINSIGANYTFAGVATPSTSAGTTDQNVFYIGGAGTYANFGTSVTVPVGSICVFKYNGSWVKEQIALFAGIDDVPTANSNNLVKSGGVYSKEKQLLQQVEDLEDALQDRDGNTLYISDKKGYVVAKIDADGIHATEVEANGKLLSQIGTSFLDDFYEDKFYITDNDGYVIASFDADGLKVTALNAGNVPKNAWYNKVIATYGDSITAQTNGDFSKPYSANDMYGRWGNKVANFLSCSKQYGRGIGSTCFKYRTSGGQVAWCKTATGEYVNRNDSYTYDNYQGHVTIPSDCTAVRGDGSSWLRITTMFPSVIKDTIDAVLVMFHNDYHQDMSTDVVWVPNDTTDPEWAASGSNYYGKLNGDYNISSVKGGIASTIMKLQMWMPQARIIIMTPISGVYASSGVIDGDFDNTQSVLMQTLAECVKNVSFRMSIPCIDNYGTDGINSINRTTYISDNIHPNADGNTMLAQSVIGGLLGIIPNLV